MSTNPRPFSVTVAPLALSIVALANVVLVVAMALTDGLPDPIALLGLPVPLAVLIGSGVIVVVASFAGWYAGLRRLNSHPGSLGLSRVINIGIPALIGLVMPSVWWQVGLAQTPTRNSDFATHVVVATAAIVVPAIIVAWRWWRARNTLGAWESTGVRPADRLTTTAPSEAVRAVTAVSSSLTGGLAQHIAAQIVESLRFHSAYLPADTVYQFRMPNGGFLTATDNLLHTRRTLTITMQSPHRNGHFMRGQIVRPKSLSPEGGWFTGADPKADRRATASLVNNVQQAFAVQDDVVLDGAVVIDPSEPPHRIR